MRTGAEIKLALDAFVTRWSGYAGTERAEAQTFLNDLFACYGLPVTKSDLAKTEDEAARIANGARRLGGRDAAGSDTGGGIVVQILAQAGTA